MEEVEDRTPDGWRAAKDGMKAEGPNRCPPPPPPTPQSDADLANRNGGNAMLM
jgi:hypothetical protein